MRWSVLLLSFLLLVGRAATAAPEGAPRAIRIATEGAYPPFNYVDNNDPAGFEIDLGRALCSSMRASCTFVLQDWDGMISGLKENRYDAIMSSMEITDDRRKRIAFSRAYYRMPSALIGPTSAAPLPAPKPSDLAGHTVGTTAESEFAAYLEAAYKEAVVRKYDKLEEAELDLLTGRVDYVLGDKLALRKFLDSREGAGCCRVIADMPVDRGPGVGVGLRKGDAKLIDSFNTAIAAVQADGTYDRIRAKYFPFDIK